MQAALRVVTPPVSGGGYAVQVASERSESGAQAAFRALQAKYAGQLSGRQPIIRRADLGAAGIYYRALVGPFATAEKAARFCSGLKAAGGNCMPGHTFVDQGGLFSYIAPEARVPVNIP